MQNFINAVAFFFILAFLSCFAVGCNGSDKDVVYDTKIEKTDTISYTEKKALLMITASVSGLVGNHELSVITAPSITDTIRLFTDELFYRKAGTDSLFIFVSSSAIPAEQKDIILNGVHVKIIPLELADTIQSYRQHYNAYGLRRLSALQ